MDRDDRDPIFMDEIGTQFFCFDSCASFGHGCRECDKAKQYGCTARKVASTA